MATAKKADIKIKSTNFTGDDGKLIYPRAHHDHIDGKPTSYPPTAHEHTIGEVEGLSISIASKVDKVIGKGLSTNDYTTTEKNKLSGIATGAQVNRTIATTIQAVAGSDNTTAMTPLRVKEAITEISPPGSRPASDVSDWAKKSSLAIGDIPTGTTGTTVAIGNHTHSQYLTSFTETDPTVPSHVKSITTGNISSWNNKFDTPTGTTSQYVRGNGSLVTFPTIPTVPSVLDTIEGNAGTATTPRTITAKNLKDIILHYSPAGARTPTAHTHSQYLTAHQSLTHLVPKTTTINSKALTGNIVLTASDVELGNVENKSSATIRSEITAGNVPGLPTSKITSGRFIKDRLPTDTLYSADLATVATSGSYNDLSNKPTIPSGTVTNVTAANLQIPGMSLTITTPTTNPTITTSISNAANFRSAIGAGTGSSNLEIGTTAGTAKAGNYHPTWSQVTSKPTWIGASKPTYNAGEVGAVPTSRTINGKALTSNITLTAADVGAGTSNLTIGTGSTNAKAGNYHPTWAQVTNKPSGIIKEVSFLSGTMVIEVI